MRTAVIVSGIKKKQDKAVTRPVERVCTALRNAICHKEILRNTAWPLSCDHYNPLTGGGNFEAANGDLQYQKSDLEHVEMGFLGEIYAIRPKFAWTRGMGGTESSSSCEAFGLAGEGPQG